MMRSDASGSSYFQQFQDVLASAVAVVVGIDGCDRR